MAQKHSWSRKKGDALCLRKGCTVVRSEHPAHSTVYRTPDMVPGAWSESDFPCGGDVPKEERAKKGKHDWAKVPNADQWRACQHKGCRWQFNARKERYRVRGATVLGEKRKPDPCKGAL